MNIEPAVVAAIVDALPPRLRGRLDALVAEGVRVEGHVVALGNATVTLADVETVTDPEQITCDCLLAPRCTHRAAVALSLPVDDAAPVSLGAAALAGDVVRLTAEQRAVVDETWRNLGQLLQVGMVRMPATLRSHLTADLHRMRVHGLVVAERGLTGLLGDGGVAAASSLLFNLWQLRRADEVPAEVVGRWRRAYGDVGGLVLQPLAAEPVLTASLFAGVQVSFVDGDGEAWHLSRVMPGGAGDVALRYHGPSDWAGLAASPRELSRHGLVMSGATASPDGRLGGGRKVRAALTDAGSWWQVVPEGHRVVTGRIEGGGCGELVVGGARLLLGDVAARLGAGPGLELLSRTGAQVACLGRGDELLGVRFINEAVRPPRELGGVWWPGLDPVSLDWVGELPPAAADEVHAEPDQWTVTSPSVAVILGRWLERVLRGGAVVLQGDSIRADVAWLGRAGAGFAAELLERLHTAPQEGSRRFDGTWQPDPEALALAWLALALY